MFELVTVKREVRALPASAQNDAERIDLIRGLEELKCAAEAAQAALTADFAASQEAEGAAAGVSIERRTRGLAHQIALARRESPHRGQRHLGLARVLATELPRCASAFDDGRVTEWRVTLIARETACLTLAHRLEIDERVAGDPESLETMGDAELVAECRRLAYALDPQSCVVRRRRAEADRHVSLRPAPDVMSQLSALLPVKDGVAVYASLKRAADCATATGDGRSRGQIMADTLVARVLGEPGAGVSINLVVSDEVLLGTADAAAEVEGYGPVPADLARELMATDRLWLRRLYVTPGTGALVAMDSRARLVPAGILRMIRLRDRTCRTPWCDAPIRHADHVRAVAERGPTSFENTQGLCEACNLAKEATGWSARPRPGPRHRVDIVTPTGHAYTSTAPFVLIA